MVNQPLTREDIDRARTRLGLTGGVQPAERSFSRTPVGQEEPSGGGGPFGFIADTFRSFVPEPVRDVLGTVAQDALSGEEFLNVPGIQAGTAIRRSFERVPVVGGALGTAFDIAAAPATLVPGAGAGRFGALGARTLGRGLGREAAIGLGAAGAAEATRRGLERVDAPTPLTLGASLGVGVLAGRRIATRTRAVDDVAKQFGEEAIAPVRKLDNLLRERVTPRRREIAAAQRTARGERFGELEDISAAVRRGDITEQQALIRRRGALRGELTDRTIEPLRQEFTDTDFNHMLRIISDSPELDSEIARTNLRFALEDLLVDGVVPQPQQIRNLERVFGRGNFNALEDLVSRKQRISAAVLDAAGLPRAVQASVDLSAPLRQGVLFAGRREFRGAFRSMLQAARSEDRANQIMRGIQSRPGFQLADSAGLELTSIGRRVAVTAREEAFQSTLATKIPVLGRLVRGSDRAYGVFLNKLRSDVFDDLVDKARHAGIEGAEFDDFAQQASRAVNILTGRGRVPASDEVLTLLNQTFFSPRLLAARFETIPLAARALLAQVDGAVALQGGKISIRRASAAERLLYREVARDMSRAFVMGTSGLALLTIGAKQAGLDARVELDPRSSDFLKARIGPTTLDPWGGFQQIARYMAQVATGETKALGTGDIREANRLELGERFIESKLAPLPGLFLDMARGTTFLGEEVQFTPTAEGGEQAASRIMPFFLQDLNDALQEQGALGLFLGIPGAFGVGVQSFETTGLVRERLARERFDRSWRDLTGAEQQSLEQEFPGDFERARVQSEFQIARDTLGAEIHGQEREAVQALEIGAPTDAVARTLSGINDDRIARNQQLFSDFGIQTGGRSDPVSTVFELRDQATRFGITDFQLLDQITEEAVARLSPAERLQWEQRRRFIHDPAAQPFFDAKTLIADAGYWAQQGDALDRFLPQIQRLDPAIETYQQLEFAIRLSQSQGDNIRALRLAAIRDRIDGVTDRLRKTLRRKDPLLDEALVLIYGLTPIRQQRG